MWEHKNNIKFVSSVFIVLSFVISLLLQKLPLTNVIGYEFSIISAFYLFIFVGIVTLLFAKNEDADTLSFFTLLKKHKLFYLLITTLPFLISFFNTLLFSVCPVWQGIAFYFVITFISVSFSFLLAITIAKLFLRFRISIFISIFILLCLGPVIELYSNPQVYFYNPIIGFFPGNIYDEDISISTNLIIYRLLNLTFLTIILLSIKNIKNRVNYYRQFVIIISIVLSVGFSLLKPLLGFATTDYILINKLGGKLSTENFNIIYPKNTDEKFVDLLGLHHEYYFELLSDKLEFKPDKKITAYIFENDEQKRKLFGAGAADVAKPWLNQIYIELNSFDKSLKHELVHVYFAEVGTTPFKIAESFNPAMIEGVAVAFEDNYNDNDPHYIAALAKNFKYNVSIKKLFSGFNFFSGLSSIAYIYSGSFIKYLAEKYGSEKISKLYSDINFQKYYGKSIEQLETEYWKFIDSLDYEFNEHKANLYFGRKPLLKRVCPRYTANQLKNAWQFYNNKDYKTAEAEFSKLLKLTESYSALLGKVYSLRKLNKNEEALTELNSQIDKYLKTSYLYNIELVLADTYLQADNELKSDSLLTLIKNQSPSKNHYFAALNRQVLLNQDVEIAKSYISSDAETKWEILSELNRDTLYLESFLSMINLIGGDEDKYNELSKILNNNFTVNNENEAFLAFKFSKTALRFSKFLTAQRWAAAAVKYAPKRFSTIYKENLRTINWIVNNRDSVKKYFRLSNND
ncbi:MAG: hypothetical protein HND52_09950 [Ignavibacteriae bacterium]|nr:hypothetical protein [Ignavibacteriota bacterium]NOG98270.1 hypothetical protein [Ignavibacteriota bacterium]